MENEKDEEVGDAWDEILRCDEQLDLTEDDLSPPLQVGDAMDVDQSNLVKDDPAPPTSDPLDVLLLCSSGRMDLSLQVTPQNELGSLSGYNNLIESEQNGMQLVENIKNNFNTEKRAGLVLLLAHMTGKLKLQLETFFMAVFCIDHIKETYTLSKNPEVLAVSALAVASKYLDKRGLKSVEVVQAATVPLSMEEVAWIQTEVLMKFTSNMRIPTIIHFLRMILAVDKEEDELLNAKVESMSFYLAEASLTSFECLNMLPSVVASSCLFIANAAHKLNQHPWGSSLEQYSRYTPKELEQCVNSICGLMSNSNDQLLHFIKEKYKDEKFGAVSDISVPLIPHSYFEIQEESRLRSPKNSIPAGIEGGS